MEILRLLRKRQLNVQEQNTLTEHEFYTTASYWRKNGLPHALLEHGKNQGLSWDKTIVLNLEIDLPGMPQLF